MSAEQVFRLPDLGEGLTEAEIVHWHVATGDLVTVDQVVVEVETAKAMVEVPVPYAGKVSTLHAEPGAVVAVGSPLISVTAVDSASDPVVASPSPAAVEQYREEERAGSGNVLIGYGTGHAPVSRRRRARRNPEAAEPAPAAVHVASAAPAGPAALAASAASDLVAARVISPLVRRLARDHGIDIAAVTTDSTHGVVRRRDVERAIAAGLNATPAVGAGLNATPAVTAPDVPWPDRLGREEEAERIPLRGLRRAVADKLSRSRSEIPDATTWVDVDATGLLETRAVLADRGIGLMALLARICVAGLHRFPELNSSVDTEAGEILRFPHVNLGFAAQTDRGLVVPVVHGANRMTTTALAAEITRLAAQARDGRLPPAAMAGGTFTLNNYGVFGVDGSNAIINHPEAAILGIGRIVDKPWVVDGQLAVRKVTQLSLTFDHRVCDGGTAGGFLRYVADRVERPATLLADL